MVIDTLDNASRYYGLHSRFSKAFGYLTDTDLAALTPGKYSVDGNDIFAIVQEYDTLDSAAEQMEAHRKYIDIQYMIRGAEMVGHAMPRGLAISKAYDENEDYLLYAGRPSFFSRLEEGMFMVFFPTDPHMPCIQTGEPTFVKKIVVKVAV